MRHARTDDDKSSSQFLDWEMSLGSSIWLFGSLQHLFICRVIKNFVAQIRQKKRKKEERERVTTNQPTRKKTWIEIDYIAKCDCCAYGLFQ